MKFSEAWLREWVNPPISSAALCEQLTSAGLEVDGASPAAPPFGGVAVGEVVAVAKHPNASRLSVCEVLARGAPAQVVCGAPNVRPGMKAPFARVGAILPEARIGKASVRGVPSEGMLCSAAELGLGDAAEGLLELPEALERGADLRKALTLDDRCIELDLTPNRGDCLSVRGIAREVAALNDLRASPPSCQPVEAATDATLPVDIDAGAACPRYLGRVVQGVDVARPTPLWMRERLRRSGLRTVDAVVDVTNYVLLELGQPLHAFDLQRLSRGIVVRLGRTGERLALLDGREVALDEETLAIADAAGAVAMAGVMGGQRSAVGPATQDIFLECAWFAPLAIGGAARRYGLQTDASQRYERGVDYTLQRAAIERATRLLLNVAGGVPGPVVVAESAAHAPRAPRVTLRRQRLHALVGEALPEAETEDILRRLEFAPARSGAGAGLEWRITAPGHRFDIAIEEDLVEEVCRVYGYNRIGARVAAAPAPLRAASRTRLPVTALQDALVGLGYREGITYSFVHPALAELLDPGVPALRLANPMSQDRASMRSSLLPGLVGALQGNLARQQTRIRLFELGQCFVASAPREPERLATLRVGGIAAGVRLPESWAAEPAPMDFYDVKGDVERLLALSAGQFRFEAADHPALHPGQSAAVMSGERVVGRLGRLHPKVERTLDLAVATFVFELEADILREAPAHRHQPVSRYPGVRRDLSVIVAAEVPAAAVETAVRQVLGDTLAEFSLFDVYQGEGIDSREKSLGLGLTLQSPSRTLADDDINSCIDNVLACLTKDFGARLRPAPARGRGTAP